MNNQYGTLRGMKCLVMLVSISLTNVMYLYGQDKLQSIPDTDPEYELSTLKPADGFEVSLFASEPMIEKPIQMNWDEKGRLWVVGSNQYPQPKPGAIPSGKVFVLEDTDGDGRADKSTVFADGLQVPTAILPGDGGVYVANSTEILHLKDSDGDGKADQRRVVLSGFGTGDTHHLIHTFRWSPDGSFYLNQSIYIYSHIETPWGVRRLEGGGVWRYRPQTQKLEIFAHGLVNPWGLQFNRYGQSFLTDGAGSEGINYAFQGATFLTAPGAPRILRGLNPGQPKHSGLDFITGRHMPESWSGTLVTNDFRANRINRFSLERLGSGYVSKQEEDLLYSDNVAFRPVDILEGPDGAIYVADWYNPIIQHGEVDFRDPRRDHENGRIWRIVKKDSPLVEIPDLPGASNLELLEYLRLPEAWTRDQARRMLKERGTESVMADLEQWVENLQPVNQQNEKLLLEAFWVYQSLDEKNESVIEQLLKASDPLIRAAAVRGLYFQYEMYPEAYKYLVDAIDDEDPVVRLEAVIGLRKSENPQAAEVATRVLGRDVDQYIDFALWQTIRELEPNWLDKYHADKDYFAGNRKKAFALKSIKDSEAIADLVKMYISGLVPEEFYEDVYKAVIQYGSSEDLTLIFNELLNGKSNRERYLEVLIAAMEQRTLKPNVDLAKIKTLVQEDDKKVAQKAITLASLWKLQSFRPYFMEWAESDDADMRSTGISALANLGDKESHRALYEYSGRNYPLELRLAAINQLVSINADQASQSAALLFSEDLGEEQILGLLAAFFRNQNGPKALKEAMVGAEISDLVARIGLQEISRMSDRRKENDDIKALEELLKGTSVEVQKPTMPQVLSEWETDRLELDIKAYGDPVKGELVYRKLGCATCHSIGGAGGKIGTDLSSLGANAPTDYIISSVLNPGNEIKDGYELNHIIKKNGNMVMGYLVRETDAEVVLRDITGKEVAVPKYQIDSHQNVPGSLMPPGLTSGLTREEFVDLIGFLSKIGEPGDFRVPTNNYVRYWEGLSVDAEAISAVQEGGLAVVGQKPEIFDWQPFYSTVSGAMPISEIDEMDRIEGVKVLKFAIEVSSPGMVNLKFDTSGVRVWINKSSVEMSESGVQINLEQGIHDVILLLKSEDMQQDFLVEVDNTGRAKPLLEGRPVDNR